MSAPVLPELHWILEHATPEDRGHLAALVESGVGDAPETLCNHFRYLRGGFLGQIWATSDYKQLVTDVADQIGADWPSILQGREWWQVATADIEKGVVMKLFENAFEAMTEEQRNRMLEELAKTGADRGVLSQVAAGSAMAAANFSGFGIYLMTSTVLGAVTSALGVALPFAAYTAMSSSLAVIIGPVGWGVLGASVLFQITRADWKRLTAGVVLVSHIRQKNGL